MKKIKSGLKKTLLSYRALPEKKQYIEFFTALLSVPVLLTVIVLNINNLKGANKSEEKEPETKTIVVTVPPSENKEENPPTPVESCIEEVGPISIDSPSENETVTDNPLVIDINYRSSEYCAVVWSYRINNGRYSDYDDNDIAIYNPPQGKINLELRVKSLISGDEEIVRRSFTYQGSADDPTATSSAN